MNRRVAVEDRPRIQRRILARIRSFDLGALLTQLDRIDIGRDEITFKSNPDPTGGGGLIEGIAFFESPGRRAEITLNLGLTGPNGLVPTYFHELAKACPDPEILDRFLHFFDHPILDSLVDALYPEGPTGAMRAWRSLRSASFSMLGVSSIATLEWVFSSVFPELRREVSRATVPRLTDEFALHAGVARLDGTGAMGMVDAPDSVGLRVDLFTEEERHHAGRKWIEIVHERFNDVVLPILRPYGLTLKFVLNVALHDSWAHIEERSAPEQGHLGYDRLRHEVARHETVVFEGAIRDGAAA